MKLARSGEFFQHGERNVCNSAMHAFNLTRAFVERGGYQVNDAAQMRFK